MSERLPSYEALAAHAYFLDALEKEMEEQQISPEKAEAIRLAAQNPKIVLSNDSKNDAKLFLTSMVGLSDAELAALTYQKTQADHVRQQAEIDEKFKAAGIPQDHKP